MEDLGDRPDALVGIWELQEPAGGMLLFNADGTARVSGPFLDEKALEFDQAPLGITGLETAVGLAFELVHRGVIDLERLVELC